MSQQKWIVRLAALVTVTAACSSEAAPEKMTVQGTVSQQLYAADVEAVAIGQDGRSFWSALDNKGDFKLVVPVGQSYRIVLAKIGPDGRNAAVARLTITGVTGKTNWITARTASTLRLGDLVPAGTLPAPATVTKSSDPSAVGTAARGSGRGGTDEEDSSGRGGSGRGGDGDGWSDGDHDDWDDDQAHSDDPSCEEKDMSESPICTAPSTSEMECSRNGSEEISESSDWSNHTDDSSPACDAGTTPPAEPSTSTSTPTDPAAPDSTDVSTK